MENCYCYKIKTKVQGFYNITSFVRQSVLDAGKKEGIAVIFTPNTDAGIVISALDENSLESEDFALAKLGGSDELSLIQEPKVKSMLTGVSQTVIVSESEPVLSNNQGICFCEFNPGEDRIFYVKIV